MLRRARPPYGRGESRWYAAIWRRLPRPGVDGGAQGPAPYGRGESRRYAATGRCPPLGQVWMVVRRVRPSTGEENHGSLSIPLATPINNYTVVDPPGQKKMGSLNLRNPSGRWIILKLYARYATTDQRSPLKGSTQCSSLAPLNMCHLFFTVILRRPVGSWTMSAPPENGPKSAMAECP